MPLIPINPLSLLAAALLLAPGCGDADHSRAKTTRADAAGADRARAESPGAGTTKPADDPEAEHGRLYGAWVADDVETKIGEARIKLRFEKRGPVHILAWSELPLVGQVRDKEAEYRISNGKVISPALRDGTEVSYRFDSQGRLVIEYEPGQFVTFHRPKQD